MKGAGKNIVVYSGYTFEQLKAMGEKNPAVLELLGLCDTLIDGPFIEEQKDLDLLFRGSQNQRIIDLTSPENAV